MLLDGWGSDGGGGGGDINKRGIEINVVAVRMNGKVGGRSGTLNVCAKE